MKCKATSTPKEKGILDFPCLVTHKSIEEVIYLASQNQAMKKLGRLNIIVVRSNDPNYPIGSIAISLSTKYFSPWYGEVILTQD